MKRNNWAIFFRLVVINAGLYSYILGTDNTVKARHINDMIFGKIGLNVEIEQQEKIIFLLQDIFNADTYQLLDATKKMRDQLQNQYQTTRAHIASMQAAGQQIAYSVFYREFLLAHQINHFDKLYKQLKNSLSTTQYLYYYYVQPFMQWLHRQSASEYDLVDALVQETLDYIEFEREYILYNYSHLLTFLINKKKSSHELPQFIDFWTDATTIEKLKKRAQHLDELPMVQFEGLLISFALQGIVLAGGTLAMQWVDEADQKIYEEYAKKQQEISDGLTTFEKKLEQERSMAISKAIDAFGQKQKELNERYDIINQQLNQEIVYLNQSINLDKPINRYLENAINWDAYFTSSPMYVPRDSLLMWYNVFNVFTSDDWQFDSNTASFWQNSLVNMPATLYWQKAAQERSLLQDDPAVHSIFTEYATAELSYDIEVRCKIVAATYPFFVGVMFNRGRWISGDPERLSWYRLLGFYGIQQPTSNGQESIIRLACAQQKINFSKQDNITSTIITPLEQIISGQDSINYGLDKFYAQTLQHDPLIFVITIKNQPSSIVVNVEDHSTETVKPLYSTTINNLDSYIYRYHGIGFMAIGAQAEFTVLKPTQLQFSNQQISDFKKELAHELQA